MGAFSPLVKLLTAPWLKPAVFVATLGPLARLVLLAAQDGLGANPVEAVTHSTGTWALVWLLSTLLLSPLARLTAVPQWLTLRRLLGLMTFFYASLHLLTYLWWDQFFDWQAIWRDVAARPFITAGWAAYAMMLPLAGTSTDGMMRRLKRRWRQLHRLVYAVAASALLHYFWLVKRDFTLPVLYLAVFVLLMAARLLPQTRTVARRRGRPGASGEAKA